MKRDTKKLKKEYLVKLMKYEKKILSNLTNKKKDGTMVE